MLFSAAILLASLLSSSTYAADDSSPKPNRPCTIHSPTTGSYFDLRTIQIQPPSSSSSKKDARIESWHSRGYDYGANFTLNFCGPVVEDLGKIEGIPEDRVANVSAFYKMNGKTYSIGQASSEPLFRGRKLVLNYTDGSPCPSDPTSYSLDQSSNDSELFVREIITPTRTASASTMTPSISTSFSTSSTSSRLGGKPTTSPSNYRTKSSLLSFLCDRDPQYNTAPKISFIGTPDSCTYFFEVRSRAACGGASSQSPSSLGPGGVFGVILGIAVVVYVVGGVAYQRTVMHQRGWRQCPNWGVWRGLGEVIGVSKLLSLVTGGRRGRGYRKMRGAGRYGIFEDEDEDRGDIAGWEPEDGTTSRRD